MPTIRSTRRLFARKPTTAPAQERQRTDQAAVDAIIARLESERQERQRRSGVRPAVPAPAKTVREGDPGAEHGTQLLRLRRKDTVTSYPDHEGQAVDALRRNDIGRRRLECVGAAELLLTEDHMVVRFDFHGDAPDDERSHRYLVDVDMSFGQLVDAEIMHLGSLTDR